MFCLGFLQPGDVKMTGSLCRQFRQLQMWDSGSVDPSQDPLSWLGRVFNPLPSLLIAPCCYCARYMLLMLLCCPGYSAALCYSAAPQLNPTTFPASSCGFYFFDPSGGCLIFIPCNSGQTIIREWIHWDTAWVCFYVAKLMLYQICK